MHDSTTIHASAVAKNGRALILKGPSGAGKSATALQLIALGATLVADDRTILTRDGNSVWARPPEPLAGLIEARHVGLLNLPYEAPVSIALVVDLAAIETERLPNSGQIDLLGISYPLFRRVDGPHFPASLLFCLAGFHRPS